MKEAPGFHGLLQELKIHLNLGKKTKIKEEE
jgi:hypothetical protein